MEVGRDLQRDVCVQWRLVKLDLGIVHSTYNVAPCLEESSSMFNFSKANVPIGSIIEFSSNRSIKATVCDETHILLGGTKMSVSGATLNLLKQLGNEKKSVQGTLYWLYDGVSLAVHAQRSIGQSSL